MEFDRYYIGAYLNGQHIGSVDPGGSTDEPGFRCMFGWGVPSVFVNFPLIDTYGFQILTEDAKGKNIELRVYGFNREYECWDFLGCADGGQIDAIQKLLIYNQDEALSVLFLSCTVT